MACIPHLVSALRNDTAEKTTWTRLCEIIESHFKGDLQHVTDTLSSLWRTVNGEGDPTTAAKSSDLPSVSTSLVYLSAEVNSELWDRLLLHASTTPRVVLTFIRR